MNKEKDEEKNVSGNNKSKTNRKNSLILVFFIIIIAIKQISKLWTKITRVVNKDLNISFSFLASLTACVTLHYSFTSLTLIHHRHLADIFSYRPALCSSFVTASFLPFPINYSQFLSVVPFLPCFSSRPP